MFDKINWGLSPVWSVLGILVCVGVFSWVIILTVLTDEIEMNLRYTDHKLLENQVDVVEAVFMHDLGSEFICTGSTVFSKSGLFNFIYFRYEHGLGTPVPEITLGGTRFLFICGLSIGSEGTHYRLAVARLGVDRLGLDRMFRAGFREGILPSREDLPPRPPLLPKILTSRERVEAER